MKVVKVYGPTACPGCGQQRAVNNDGTVRWHASDVSWERCPGTRQRVEAPVIGGLW